MGNVGHGDLVLWLGSDSADSAESSRRLRRSERYQLICDFAQKCAYCPPVSTLISFLDEFLVQQIRSEKKLQSNTTVGEAAGEHDCCYGLIVLEEEESGDLLGMVFVRKVYENLDLDYICTHPQHRNKGIAKKLMLVLSEACTGCGVKRGVLEVGVLNSQAIALYQAFGFYFIGIRKAYYSSGESAHIMEKVTKL